METIKLINDFKEKNENSYLKGMIKEFVRKDFEVLKAQNKFFQVFNNDMDIFSKYDDSISGIKYCIELASGKRVTEDDEYAGSFIALVFDAIVEISFFCFRKDANQVNTDKIVDLIYDCYKLESESNRKDHFIRTMKRDFPSLNLDHFESRTLAYQ